MARDLVSRETSALDEARVVSAAVESVAENLVDSVVAPPLLRGLRTAGSARVPVREHGGRHDWVSRADRVRGKAAARLDDL